MGAKFRSSQDPEGNKDTTPRVKVLLRLKPLGIRAGIHLVATATEAGAVGCVSVAADNSATK